MFRAGCSPFMKQASGPDNKRPARWLSLIGGALVGLAWLPYGLAPLFPFGFALALAGLRRTTGPRNVLAAGLLFGGAFWAVGAHFLLVLVSYSPLGALFYLLAVAYGAAGGAAFFGAAAWISRRSACPLSLAFVALYPLLELVRTLGDLSDPADSIVHSLAGHPAWLPAASLGGPGLVVVWTVATGAILEWAWRRRANRKAAVATAALGFALWLLPPLAYTVTSREASAPKTMRVAVVQPAFSVAQKHDPTRWPALWSRLERLTRRAAQDAELVVWPESARPGPLLQELGEPLRDDVVAPLAREVGTPILYGSEIAMRERGRLRALYNGAVLITPDGRRQDWYGKRRLLPFAEGLPFASLFGINPADRFGSGSAKKPSVLTMLGAFSPGPRATLFEVGDARIGVLICYEGLYPRMARGYRKDGANLLAILTNDAWWGRSSFTATHADVASARAKENRLPIVRAANDGVSGAYDAHGRNLGATELDESTVLHVDVPLADDAPSLYAKLGPWPEGLAALFLAVALAHGAWRRRTRLSGARTESRSSASVT